MLKLKNINCCLELKKIGQTTKKHFCINRLCKNKAEYFQALNIKDLPDNRKLRKTKNLYFSNKGLNSNKLMFKEKKRPITKEKSLAAELKTYSVNPKKLGP